MKTTIISLLFAVCLFGDANAQTTSNNFTRYQLASGWSLEIPESWKATKTFNQDMSELIQAGSDSATKKVLGSSAGKVDTQLMAFKNLFGQKIALTVSILHTKNSYTQDQLASLSEDEINKFTNIVFQGAGKSLVDAGCDPKSRLLVDIRKYDKNIVLNSHLNEPPDGRVTLTSQIMNGNQALQLTFIYKQSSEEVWDPFINRILESVIVP